ncbi:MAG: FAD:protein FMN transferase [Rikenellaceae bacterium]
MRYYLHYILALLVLCTACSQAPSDYLYASGSMLGTTYHIKADLPIDLCGEVEQCALRLDAQMKSEMSIFDTLSRLSLINANRCDSLTEALEFNIRLADSISRLSGGLYDITVAPLVKAWGFVAKSDMVTAPNVDSLLEFVGHQGLAIENGRLIKVDERMQIDLNSIAKGYTVDRLAAELEAMGARNYMVDIGGEIRLRGVNPSGMAWRIGIETPFDGNMSEGAFLERRIALPDSLPWRAVATSGNYRRFHITDDGRKVVHTINPITGASSPSALLSATVLAPTCALADAYATMLMAAGDQHAERLAEQITNCEVYLIYNRGARMRGTEDLYEVYFSNGMQQMLLED